MYPNDLLYSKEHEWVRLEGDTCTLGITEFAQSELGEIVFVELPEGGYSFEAHDEIGTVESVKAVAEVYTPVSGEIVETNEILEERPELINEDPHGEGWMVKLRIDPDSDELDELMNAGAYEEFVGGEE